MNAPRPISHCVSQDTDHILGRRCQVLDDELSRTIVSDVDELYYSIFLLNMRGESNTREAFRGRENGYL